MRVVATTAAMALVIVTAGCNSGAPGAPSGPTALRTRTLGSDASASELRLKAESPVAVQPKGGGEIDSLQARLEWQNAKGTYLDVNFEYEVEFYKENISVGTWNVAEGTGDRTSFTVPVELEYGKLYRWRVRARYLGAFTPFSTTADFKSPPPPFSPGQPYGPQRSIGAHEALGIIIDYHNAIGADLGASSTRESRIDFFFSAVAVVHYGHPVFNPGGGDRGWCVKDAGGGRPPSDDVLVACASRDSWDTIGGAGTNGYTFHLDYIGILPGGQNVYPPPLSSLPK